MTITATDRPTVVHVQKQPQPRFAPDDARRVGLSRRDVLAFVEAWEKAGERVPLADYLGWDPAPNGA